MMRKFFVLLLLLLSGCGTTSVVGENSSERSTTTETVTTRYQNIYIPGASGVASISRDALSSGTASVSVYSPLYERPIRVNVRGGKDTVWLEVECPDIDTTALVERDRVRKELVERDKHTTIEEDESLFTVIKNALINTFYALLLSVVIVAIYSFVKRR
jgi:hypothetical protein